MASGVHRLRRNKKAARERGEVVQKYLQPKKGRASMDDPDIVQEHIPTIIHPLKEKY